MDCFGENPVLSKVLKRETISGFWDPQSYNKLGLCGEISALTRAR